MNNAVADIYIQVFVLYPLNFVPNACIPIFKIRVWEDSPL